jgi:hypothetical protein
MSSTYESDAFAVAMLVVIFSALGLVLLLLFCMRRLAAQRDQHVDALLEELAEEQKQPVLSHSEREAKLAAWERNADWWKQDVAERPADH